MLKRISFIIIAIVFLIYIFLYKDILPKNYNMDYIGSHNYLTNGDYVIVDEHILDHKVSGKYIFLLRIPALTVDCENSKIFRLITYYTDKIQYVTVDSENEKVYEDNSEKQFLERLKNLQIPKIQFAKSEKYWGNKKSFFDEVSRCDNNIKLMHEIEKFNRNYTN